MSTEPRKISERGLELIKSFESFVPWPYDDALPMVKQADGTRQYREFFFLKDRLEGTLTIGYGHTKHDGKPKIVSGMRLTEKEACDILDADLDVIEREVNEELEGVSVTQDQFDALVSFHFNTGAFTPGRLITRYVREGKHFLAMNQLKKFRTSGGRILRGLERRRAAEIALYEGRWDDAQVLMKG